MKKHSVTERRLSGAVTTEYRQGSDGTAEMQLVVSKTRTLRGYGHDERSAAMALADELLFIATRLAQRHDFEIEIDHEKTTARMWLLRCDDGPSCVKCGRTQLALTHDPTLGHPFDQGPTP